MSRLSLTPVAAEAAWTCFPGSRIHTELRQTAAADGQRPAGLNGCPGRPRSDPSLSC